jgi:hypothetical protein
LSCRQPAQFLDFELHADSRHRLPEDNVRRFRNRQHGLRDQWRAGTIDLDDVDARVGAPGSLMPSMRTRGVCATRHRPFSIRAASSGPNRLRAPRIPDLERMHLGVPDNTKWNDDRLSGETVARQPGSAHRSRS